MVIKSGQIYHNRTLEYLYPLLRSYGDHLYMLLNHLPKLAVGIDDLRLRKELKVCYDNHLFVMVDMNYMQFEHINIYHDVLNYNIVETAYLFEMIRPNVRVIVIKLPDNYPYAIENFKNGNYRSIVGEHRVNTYHNATIAYKNATYDPALYKHYLSVMKEKFDYTGGSMMNNEYDLPPTMSEEVFHHQLINDKHINCFEYGTKKYQC